MVVYRFIIFENNADDTGTDRVNSGSSTTPPLPPPFFC